MHSISQSIDVSYSLTGGSDYQDIRAEFFDVFLTFDNTNRQQSFSVAITNDSIFEPDVENFMLELRFDPFLPPPFDVILRPNVSVVNIVDVGKTETTNHIIVYYLKVLLCSGCDWVSKYFVHCG